MGDDVTYPRPIRVSSRALGPRLFVATLIYDTQAEMINAAIAYNGDDQLSDRTAAVTQTTVTDDQRALNVTIRLSREHLTSTVVLHEMHHAATALYGAHVPDRPSRTAHLNHYNEPFAHLYSDLAGSLTRRLYDTGCWK